MTDTLRALSTLVLKDHVALGGLGDAERLLALALVHATLPPDARLSEREINEALKKALAGAACWLSTDHVELRRWLVDTGWLTRDGFGHQYHVLPHSALPPDYRGPARTLATVSAERWVQAERARRSDERAARKARWLERGGAAA
jgi:hypothetical protein